MKKIPILYLLLCLASCRAPECVDTPAFSNLGPANSEVYQAAVRDLLSEHTPEDFRYYFLSFVDEGTTSYMMTSFRNEEVCVDVKLLVDKWDKLGGMKQHNGKAYPKELIKLKWVLKNVADRPEVVYVDMRRIID